MNIVICEDNINHLNYIKSCVEDTILSSLLKCEISLCTTSADRVLRYVENNSIVTLYFLDVDLKSSIDGFALASKIREKDWHSFIVFITGFQDKANMTFEYKLEVMDYIVKGQPNVSNKIKDCLLLAYNRQDTKSDNLITLSNKNSKACIKKSDIYYIESIKQSHKIVFYYKNGKFEIRANLKDIMKNLGTRFIRCNKSLIVNKAKVREVNSSDKTLILDNNYICYYSNDMRMDEII